MSRFRWWRKLKGGLWVRSRHGLTGWYQVNRSIFSYYKRARTAWELEDHTK